MADRLARGSGYLVKVGHRFYAGEDREIKEVEVKEAIDRAWSEHWQGHPRHASVIRARRKGSTANYMKSNREKAESKPKAPVIRRELTGKVSPRLSDDQSDAKIFRTKKAVDSTCERLKRLYASLDVKISVQFIEGGPK